MGLPSVLSLDVRTSSMRHAVGSLSRFITTVASPSVCLVLATAELANHLPGLAREIGALGTRIPWILAASTAVGTERGEFEGTPGLAALAFRAPSLSTVRIEATGESLVQSIARAVDEHRVDSAAHLALLDADAASLDFQGLSNLGDDITLFGAISPIRGALHLVRETGNVERATGIVVGVGGLGQPAVSTSSACRLVSATATVTETHGSVVLKIDNQPALGWLERTGTRIGSSEQLHLVLVEPGAEPKDGAVPISLRTLRGIDPSRQALVLAGPIARGTMIAIGVRDAAVSRKNLETALHKSSQKMAGCAPRFGLYFDDVGRGRGLYGKPDVDLRMIRQRLGEFPLIGMRSLVELGAFLGPRRAHTLAGLLALFKSPS